MKKINYLLSLMLLCCFTFLAYAQESATLRVPYRQVIISEAAINTGPGGQPLNYVELTNMGDSSVNLNDFYILGRHSNVIGITPIRDEEGQLINVYYDGGGAASTRHARLLDYILQPGQSFVISNVFDATTLAGAIIQREQLVERTHMFVHRSEPGTEAVFYHSFPEYQVYDFDSVSPYWELLRHANNSQLVLSHRLYDEEGNVIDSIATDAVQFEINEVGNMAATPSNVAGVEQATVENILVRKSNITHGTINWDLSRGVSQEDSEWLLVPQWYGRDVWTTIGEHGDFSVSLTSDNVSIDMDQKIITVPWGIQKDSLRHQIELGPGMAWQYHEDIENFEGMGLITTQTGDSITFYATGEIVEQVDFRIESDLSAENVTKVLPKRILNFPEGIPTWSSETWYYTTRFETIMDTIGNVAFSTRADTLLARLEIIPGAEWEIIWLDDDKTRVDLKRGDILRVTAKNGVDTKDYFIDVLPYTGSSNSNLSAITWPDKPGFIDGWVQDTIPGFSPTVRNYVINLPFGINDVPALQVVPQNLNAVISINPAINLTGSIGDRTTLVIVQSEDSLDISEYRITFQQDKPAFLIQPYESEPIFSEIFGNQLSWNAGVEIFNPGTEPIDLSGYMLGIFQGGTPQDPATYIQNVITQVEGRDYGQRYNPGAVYVPGFKWPATRDDWDLNPGKLIFDAITNPYLEAGDVFVVGNGHWTDDPRNHRLDVVLGGNTQRWGETDLWDRPMTTFVRGRSGVYLWKILNDSILQGTKAISDPLDFELVEFFGGTNAPWSIAGREIGNNTPFTIIRKPHIYTPGTEQFRGWGTSEEDSDWRVVYINDVYEGLTITNPLLNFNIGTHFINEITSYRSTVLSNVYLVDEGYTGSLNINGVGGGENVEEFLNNLVKYDPDQDLKVYPASGSEPRELGEIVVNGDNLVVISADGVNSTTYSISTTPLSNEVDLTAISGSGLQVSGQDTTGTITGFASGTKIMDILTLIEKPATATLSVVNEKGELIPSQILNTDTVKVRTTATSNVFFLVRAQNGVNFRLYSLQPATDPTAAYVLSDLYTVLQDSSAVTLVPFGTSVPTLLGNLYAASGGSIVIYDKAGNERSTGVMNYDDFLVVTSQDGSQFKVYYLQFINEPAGLEETLREIPGAVSDLRLESLSPDRTEVTIEWNYVSGFEQGFKILRDGVEVGTVFSENSFTDSGLTPHTTYNYTVFAFNELGSSEERNIEVLTTHVGTDQLKENELMVFPSITKGSVYFRNLSDESRVKVADALGRIIIDKKGRDIRGEISLSSYSNGVYMISISENNRELKNFKIIKQ